MNTVELLSKDFTFCQITHSQNWGGGGVSLLIHVGETVKL